MIEYNRALSIKPDCGSFAWMLSWPGEQASHRTTVIIKIIADALVCNL